LAPDVHEHRDTLDRHPRAGERASVRPFTEAPERGSPGDAGSPAVQPPSTGNTTPVIALCGRLAGRRWRRRSRPPQQPPSGIRRVAACTNVSFSKNAAVIGVMVNPGATAFTRTPCSAQSIASERVSAATAPLLVVYAA
jgi:hypothetical protein